MHSGESVAYWMPNSVSGNWVSPHEYILLFVML
jgi:hypothetical protein